MARADANAKVLYDWAEQDAVAREPGGRSGDALQHLGVPEDRRSGGCRACRIDGQRAFVKQIESMLDKENAARDIAGHRDAPPHLRIWCGCDGGEGRPGGAHALARLGLRRSQGRPRQGCVTRHCHPRKPRSGYPGPSIHASARKHALGPRFRGNDGGDDATTRTCTMAPRVLIADQLSPAAVDIFKQRGVDTDVKVGLSKEELEKIIAGLRRPRRALRHQGHREDHRRRRQAQGDRPRRHRRRQHRREGGHRQGHHRDEHALRQFHHHRRARASR